MGFRFSKTFRRDKAVVKFSCKKNSCGVNIGPADETSAVDQPNRRAASYF
jgi:hypothetical protein